MDFSYLICAKREIKRERERESFFASSDTDLVLLFSLDPFQKKICKFF